MMLRNVIMVLLVNALTSLSSAENYCPNIIRRSNSSRVLHFTKDAISQEYAISKSFKSLSCCASGYRTIEW